MLNKWAPAKARVVVIGGIAIVRRKELGNNCGFIIEGLKDLGVKASIVEVKDAKNLNWAIRWGTTSPIPNKDTKVINHASAITETSDKGTFRLKAHASGLTPKTWGSMKELAEYEGEVGDIIIRSRHHERSEGIFLCSTPEQADKAVKAINGPYYISEYVKKDREWRVFVANGRVLMVFEKIVKDKKAVSWGCVDEGSLVLYRWSQWPLHVVENAIKAFNLSKLHFGAVDVIEKDGKAYFLEVNTAPEVWPYYGARLADAFKYMMDGDKRKTIPVKDYKSWKSLIHPSISDAAIV